MIRRVPLTLFSSSISLSSDRLRTFTSLFAAVMISISCSDGPVEVIMESAGVSGGQQSVTGGMMNAGVEINRPPLQPDELENPLGARPPIQTCQLPTPAPVSELQLTPAVDYRFQRPIWYGEPALLAPWSFVAEQGGRLLAYQEDQAQEPELFFDVTVSRVGNEEGLLGLAFHPELASSPYLFTYYSSSGCSAPNVARCSILSRWTLDGVSANGVLPQVDQSSEVILMEIPQPYSNHNGGDLRFGQDGYLYVSLGDGGAGGDPINHAQRPETILGSVLRLNIDQPDTACGTAYSIPSDNPFVDNACGQDEGGLPEVWAWGLRNSWRMSFDRETGALWAADVGQDKWEEVNIIEGGKNYGWRPVEGPECFESGCDLTAYEAPIHSYNHDIGRSITGGFVYRGQEHVGLRGFYVFSDFETGKLMSFSLDTPEERVILAESNSRFTSFGETRDGELRLLTFDQPSVLKLTPLPNSQPPELEFPTRLSDTGCFSDTARGELAPSVIPYSVNLPFWSDEAEKERAFALPAGAQMSLREAGVGVDVPIGSVLVKNFYLSPIEGERRRIETRLMHYSERGWVGYSYRWEEDQSDAILVPQALDVTYSGPRGDQTWAFLSQNACTQCHTAASNRTLGLEVQQLNRRIITEDGWYNQLTAFAEAGYLRLTRQPEELESFAHLTPEALLERADSTQNTPETDPNMLLRQQARAYLHVNCASCHRPGGAPTVELDLREGTALTETGLCNGEPLHGDLGVEGARHLIPGEPERSLVLLRLNRRDEEQMPPIGSNLIDFGGNSLLSLWISQLERCE